ncbi:hypothetical protein B296_00023749 [Ensete ventricosum]|uniref:Thioredoxin domain-containing protein n=1 Tax=Ensete ventricosum TaxID=4639 RepID=A0A427AIA7_ENSVE|nr:hypothetical protein B296_00023749 [Ensete ventricosum]
MSEQRAERWLLGFLLGVLWKKRPGLLRVDGAHTIKSRYEDGYIVIGYDIYFLLPDAHARPVPSSVLHLRSSVFRSKMAAAYRAPPPCLSCAAPAARRTVASVPPFRLPNSFPHGLRGPGIRTPSSFSSVSVARRRDAHDYPQIAAFEGIFRVPTVLLFKNGEKLKSLTGTMPKSLYVEAIEQLLSH